jgi:hypothetical protein
VLGTKIIPPEGLNVVVSSFAPRSPSRSWQSRYIIKIESLTSLLKNAACEETAPLLVCGCRSLRPSTLPALRVPK